jgi:hypothetical protein
MATYNNQNKKHLRDRIHALSVTEHEEIYKMLNSKQCPYSKNSNGIFFNLTQVDDEILETVEKFVDFCIVNDSELDEYARKINECKMYNTAFDNVSFDKGVASISLNDAICANNVIENDWQSVLANVKSTVKVDAFVKFLDASSERVMAKKNHTRFINAKKRYSKKQVCDKKSENDLQNNLTLQEYTYI